jgi:hypothetical protein
VSHVSRRTVAFMPLLLILGIIAQGILLILVILLYIPFMIWPGILDRPYKWITAGMARIMIKSMRNKRKIKPEMEQAMLPFRYTTGPP